MKKLVMLVAGMLFSVSLAYAGMNGGSCGEGKCGGDMKKKEMKSGSCGAGKCGGDMKKKDGMKDGMKKKSGSCGAGKCG